MKDVLIKSAGVVAFIGMMAALMLAVGNEIDRQVCLSSTVDHARELHCDEVLKGGRL